MKLKKIANVLVAVTAVTTVLCLSQGVVNADEALAAAVLLLVGTLLNYFMDDVQ